MAAVDQPSAQLRSAKFAFYQSHSQKKQDADAVEENIDGRQHPEGRFQGRAAGRRPMMLGAFYGVLVLQSQTETTRQRWPRTRRNRRGTTGECFACESRTELTDDRRAAGYYWRGGDGGRVECRAVAARLAESLTSLSPWAWKWCCRVVKCRVGRVSSRADWLRG